MRARDPEGRMAKAVEKDESYWQKKRLHTMDLRVRGWSMDRISRYIGVSKGFVSKWCRRLKEHIAAKKRSLRAGTRSAYPKGDGIRDAVASLSRRPKTIHRKKDLFRGTVTAARDEYPFMGAQKMKAFLNADISHQSIYEMTVESGRLVPGKKKKRIWRSFQREHSNSLWQIDYKEFEHGIYMLSVKDDHSRCILAADVRRTMRTDDVLEIMNKTIRMFGLPEQILSDHGTQWCSSRGGCTRFDEWCSDNGIEHIMGGIRKPTTQGKIERWHGSVLREAELPPAGSSPEQYGEAVQKYVEFHNNERPHWGIDLRIPLDIYLADLKNPDRFASYGVHEVP